MIRGTLPALLGLCALFADVVGSHGVALTFVLLAIPAAFAFALDAYGEVLEAQCGGFKPLAAAVALVVLVFSAALRSPAVVGGVPQLAVSGLVIALLLYALVAAVALQTAAVSSRTSRNASTRSALPFSSSAPSGSTSAAEPSSATVLEPSTT